MNFTNHSDEKLAELSQSEEIAFEILVDRYSDKIRRYVSRLIGNWQESEDITQEVFLKAYINIASFDVKLKFSSWLYRIAHNISVNYIKKHYRFTHVEFNEEIRNKLLEDKDVLEKIIKTEKQENLIDAMEKLKSSDREVLELYYFEENSYIEISDILQISINSVGPKINRAKKRLKDIMKKNKNE